MNNEFMKIFYLKIISQINRSYFHRLLEYVIIISILYFIGGIIIKRRCVSKKEWSDKRSLKILKNLSKPKKNRSNYGFKTHIYNSPDQKKLYKHGKNEYKFIAPSVLNIEKNPEESLNFFNEIINKRNRRKFNASYFIDVSSVNDIGIDALMYTLAILYDTKHNNILRTKFEGNIPSEGEARKTFIESGFLSYVQTNKVSFIPESEKIQIRCGTNVDSQIAKDTCIFVQKFCSLTRINTIPLYNIIIELMANTNQHA